MTERNFGSGFKKHGKAWRLRASSASIRGLTQLAEPNTKSLFNNWSEANVMLKSVSGEDLSKSWGDIPTGKHVRTPKQKEALKETTERGKKNPKLKAADRAIGKFWQDVGKLLEREKYHVTKKLQRAGILKLVNKLEETAKIGWGVGKEHFKDPMVKLRHELGRSTPEESARMRDRKAQKKYDIEHGPGFVPVFPTPKLDPKGDLYIDKHPFGKKKVGFLGALRKERNKERGAVVNLPPVKNRTKEFMSKLRSEGGMPADPRKAKSKGKEE